MAVRAESQPIPQDVLAEAVNSTARGLRLGRKTRWTVGLGLLVSSAVTPGVLGVLASKYPRETAQALRQTIGLEPTLKLEGIQFAVKDLVTQELYKLGRGPGDHPYIPDQIITKSLPPADQTPPPGPVSPSSFSAELPPTVEPVKPEPFIPPDTRNLIEKPMKDDGSWSIGGLPTTENDLLMARTIIRVNSSRPYASLVVLIMDSRRIQLHMVGGAGTEAMGGGKGPGRVPDADIPKLSAVWNGGFQFSHAEYGIYMDGIEYKPLKPGYATVATFKDGSIKMGTWGQGDLTKRTDDMVAIRQNAVLLVDNGEVTPAAKDKETDTGTWGLMAAGSTNFITYRSAIGLDEKGNLMIADGSNMSALDLAKGMWAAGAVVAMQLDINQNWIETGIAVHYSDGQFRLVPLRDDVSVGYNYVDPKHPQGRDIMYVTQDDSRFKPRRRKNRGFHERPQRLHAHYKAAA
ncbi:MAG: phosphodiester glycosidase family protein [Candidatus Levyibacteriota bacterium]